MGEATDPLEGTTIGPDGQRVPAEDVDDGEGETAESVGYGTARDAVVTGDLPNEAAEAAHEMREASGSQAEAEQGVKAPD